MYGQYIDDIFRFILDNFDTYGNKKYPDSANTNNTNGITEWLRIQISDFYHSYLHDCPKPNNGDMLPKNLFGFLISRTLQGFVYDT